MPKIRKVDRSAMEEEREGILSKCHPLNELVSKSSKMNSYERGIILDNIKDRRHYYIDLETPESLEMAEEEYQTILDDFSIVIESITKQNPLDINKIKNCQFVVDSISAQIDGELELFGHSLTQKEIKILENAYDILNPE